MKYFKNNIIAISTIFVLIAFFSCVQEKEKATKSTAFIKGTINNTRSSKLIMQNNDPYILTVDTLNLDTSSTFAINLEITKPNYYRIQLGRDAILLYVRPGDTVDFTLDASNIYSTTRFSGNAPIYNDYLLRFQFTSSVFQKEIMKFFGREEAEVINVLDSIRILREKDIDALVIGNPELDQQFLNMEKGRVLYEWALMKRIYPDYYAYINNVDKTKLNLSANYDSYLGELNLNDKNIERLSTYTAFISAYYRNKAELYYTEESLRDVFPSYVNYQIDLYEKAGINQRVKEILIYRAVESNVSNNGADEYDLYSELFLKSCTNKEMLEIINNKLAEWSHLKKGMPIKDLEAFTISGEKMKLSDMKGKWIYIDIWATWCNPCVGEIPKLKELEEKFRGKNIEFVSISVDRTPAPWKKMVEEKDLKGVQLWVGQNAILKDFYKVKGIPRFMIIDPLGNIYDASAKRPTMNVESELNELLLK